MYNSQFIYKGSHSKAVRHLCKFYGVNVIKVERSWLVEPYYHLHVSHSCYSTLVLFAYYLGKSGA